MKVRELLELWHSGHTLNTLCTQEPVILPTSNIEIGHILMFVNMSSKHLYLAISQCRASWERGFLMKGWELGPDRHRECQVEPVLCRSYKIASIVDYKPAHSINNSIWAAHLARRSTVPRKSANASVTACIYTSAPLYILCERALVGRPRGEDFYLLICKYPPLCWLVTHYTLIGVCYSGIWSTLSTWHFIARIW